MNERNVVYCIKNEITGDCYAGITTRELSERIDQHFNQHSKHQSANCENRTSLYKDFEIYGKENFSTSILYRADSKRELMRAERYFQSQPAFRKYAKKEENRDTRKKHGLRRVKLIGPNGIANYYPNPNAVTKAFNCERSNIIRSLRGEYKFKRAYQAEYVSELEYQINRMNQLALF